MGGLAKSTAEPHQRLEDWCSRPSKQLPTQGTLGLLLQSAMGAPHWHTAMHTLRLQRLPWIYCPGHAGVSGNERADRLASTADITSGLQLDRAEVLRCSRNSLNMDRSEHHSIDRLKERGVEKGSGRHSTLQGGERSVFNQANIGTVSRATLGRLLRDRAERVWTFPSATMSSSAETETEMLQQPRKQNSSNSDNNNFAALVFACLLFQHRDVQKTPCPHKHSSVPSESSLGR